jgi:purine-binding chemotaxis protein CheW
MKKELQSLLKMRAVAMAKEAGQKKKILTIMEVIEFTLATESYGIESAFVRKVYPLKDYTPLPGVPSFILGLKKLFNLPDKGLGELSKVIILNNEKMEFGILADEVNRTKVIYLEELLPVPPTVTGIGEEYLKGVTKDRLIILNTEKLLMDKNIIVDDKVN